MAEQTEKPDVVYAFIDAQNLRMGIKNNIYQDKAKTKVLFEGWPLDYRKFRQYLTDKYGVSTAYMFMGEVEGYDWLYQRMRDKGYEVVLKKTVPQTQGDGTNKPKGNVDAELVLHASALTYSKFDKAVIVSGDGDFVCLLEYLEAENKLLKILAPNFRYSSLLNKFGSRVDIISNKRDELESKAQN